MKRSPLTRVGVIALSSIVLAFTLGEGRAQTLQTFPNKPIRVFVPFAAGGAVDALARLLSQKLQESLGQPVIVENRAGAGGNIGAEAVAKSPPDGYTILQNTNGQAISPSLYRTLPFDTVKDFIPVTQLVSTSTVLVANPKLPARSVKELIALAKTKAGGLNYGMTGVGNSLHLTMEMFKRAAGIEIQPIPYRGDAPLNTALIAGEVDVAIVPLATIVSHVETGLVRALAVNSAQRSPLLPDVPTVAEDGIPAFEAAGWQGYFVPANTPREIVNQIYRETAKVIMDPEMQERLRAMGNDPVASSPEAFAVKFKDDMDRFASVIKEVGIPLN